MIRFTLILIGTVGVLNVVSAANENITIEQIYDMAQSVLNSTEKWQEDLKNYSVEGRRSKFFPFGLLPFHALWGFGGLNALAVLFAIKFKLLVVASIIAFTVYYYSKWNVAKKCRDHHGYREGAVYPAESSYSGAYYSSPITSYSSPFAGDISSHSFEPYSSYHDIHSDIPSYAFDHSDHHHDHHDHHDFDHHDFDHHDYDHHSHDFDHFAHDHSSIHDTPPPQGNGVAPPPPPPPPSGPADDKDASGDSLAMSPTYRRVGRHRRAAKQQPADFIDIGELAFRFLGVDTEGCRKRFVCELDFRAKTNPITRLAFTFIGRNFFERYRVLDENASKPEKFSDCAKMYNDCKDAEKYNNTDDDEEEEQKEMEETESHSDKNENSTENSSENASENSSSNEPDENEGAGDSPVAASDNSINNVVRRKRNHKLQSNFIFNRKISFI